MRVDRERNGHMTAAVLYGAEDLKVESVDIPALADDEVLVRVEVALTCGTDLKVWKQGFHQRMIKPPSLFGHELAGVIELKGSAVNGGFREGMRVVPANSAPCNICLYCRKGQPNLCEDLLFNNGAYSEYIRIPGRIVRQNMLHIPENVSFVDAAMAEPLACVLRGIHEMGINPGDTVVVIGCGPIGLKFIRILSGRGMRVIAIGKRKSQMRAAERLGAIATFDAAEIENPVSLVRQISEEGRGADAVIEAVGTAATWQWALQMVRKGGALSHQHSRRPASSAKDSLTTEKRHAPDHYDHRWQAFGIDSGRRPHLQECLWPRSACRNSDSGRSGQVQTSRHPN